MEPEQKNQQPISGGADYTSQQYGTQTAVAPPQEPNRLPADAFSPDAIYSSAADVYQPAWTQEPSSSADMKIEDGISNTRPQDEEVRVLPISPGQIISGSGFTTPPDTTPKDGKFKNKRRIVSIAAGAALLISGIGVIFGWYLPNRPENVYSTGLDRTGEVMEKLVLEGLKNEKLENVRKSEISGKVNAEGEGISYSGSFSSRYDPKLNDSSLDFNYKQDGEAEKSLGLKLLSELPDGSNLPDIYIQLTGLKSLGLDAFMPGASDYEGKWISIPSKYLASLMPERQEEQKEGFSYRDASDLATITIKRSREYLLTSDTEKAVLVNRSFVGTETMEGGITANRYNVGINKANAKKYCYALITELMSAEAYKRLPGATSENIEADKKDSIKSCQDNVEQDIDDGDTFDMWVDKKFKLIHKIRITDEKDSQKYYEIGQNYEGGDNIPLFVLIHNGKEKYDSKLVLDVNRKTYTTSGSFSFDQTGDSGYKVTASFEFKPFEGDIKINKPAGAVHIQEVLKRLGLSSLIEGYTSAGASSSSVATKAKDTERMTDINATHGQLEFYYAMHGFYPALSEINSPSWRSANLPDLSNEALKDPDGSEPKLADRGGPGRYDYTAAGCNGAGVQCRSYTLSATLSDGSHYTKQSLGDY